MTLRFLIFVTIISITSDLSARTWTRTDGRQVEAELAAKTDTKVKLRPANGRVFEMNISDLIPADQAYLKTAKIHYKRPLGLPENAKYHDGKWYAVIEEQVTWKQARDKAQKMRGILASSKNAETNEFILKLTGNIAVWIGGTDEKTEGIWIWQDGERITFKKWSKGKPDNQKRKQHYMIFWGTDKGNWTDGFNGGPASSKRVSGYVVEWPHR